MGNHFNSYMIENFLDYNLGLVFFISLIMAFSFVNKEKPIKGKASMVTSEISQVPLNGVCKLLELAK